MFYQAELSFLQSCLAKCHVQTLLVLPQALLIEPLDLGIRKLVGAPAGICSTCAEVVENIKDHTVYFLSDAYACSFLFFRLPETEQLLLVGPFVNAEMTTQLIMEGAEKRKLSPSMIPELENYYGSVPVLPRNSRVFVMLEAFCEKIWPDTPFEVVDINVPHAEFSLPPLEGAENENPLWKMELMEKRYSYENEMMKAVAKGQAHKAQMMFPVFSALSFERRLSDPLRNMKNYCIIMNTLLRKAAEEGGVHPVFLDRISSEYARKIESLSAVGMVQVLMMEMFEKYCRLVRKHSLKHYSTPVRKTIIAIESSLNTDITLGALAEQQGISQSYLSRLFKKETEMNITEYINQRRMEHAENLLLSTKLQIQTIAQHCGIMDVQYFSRLFKKIKGHSPVEYRKMHVKQS